MKKKKNILFVFSTLPNPRSGGVERVTYRLMSGLEERGYKCFFLLCYRKNRKTHIIYENKRIADLNSFIIDHKISYIINQNILDSYFAKEYRKIKNPKSHLINVCHGTPGWQIIDLKQYLERDIKRNNSLLSKITKIKIAFLPLYRFYILLKLRYNDRINYKTSELYILLSDRLIDVYCTLFKKEKCNKIISIPNPLSFDNSFDIVNLQKKEKIALVVARLDEYPKRISMILKIWKEIEKKSDWKLIIVGDGPYKNFYLDFVNQNSLKNVFFTGNQDPYYYYEKAAVFLMTSSFEGFPMTLLESQQMGVVPIAMDGIKALSDIITNNVNGLIIKNNDIDEFSKKLLSCMQNDSFRTEMAQNAIKDSTKYNLNEILNKWENAFTYLK